MRLENHKATQHSFTTVEVKLWTLSVFRDHNYFFFYFRLFKVYTLCKMIKWILPLTHRESDCALCSLSLEHIVKHLEPENRIRTTPSRWKFISFVHHWYTEKHFGIITLSLTISRGSIIKRYNSWCLVLL